MDPNYSLPPNVALITLEVDQMQHINVLSLLTLRTHVVHSPHRKNLIIN